jgi:hypothetical protein
MTSVDTNILLYAHDVSAPEHAAAREFFSARAHDRTFAISEFVLMEFYALLRNPAVVAHPLDPAEAVRIVSHFRRNAFWKLIDYPAPVMAKVWAKAAEPGFARRRIFDLRLAFSLQAAGVAEFATRNVRDFDGIGFSRVWDPLHE